MLRLQFWNLGATPDFGLMYQISSEAFPAEGLMIGGGRKLADGTNPLSHCNADPVVEGLDKAAVVEYPF